MDDNNKKNLTFALLGIIIIVAIILRFDTFLKERQERENSGKNIEETVALEKENSEVIKKASEYRADDKKEIDEEDIYIGDLESKIKIIVYEDYNDKISAQYSKNIDKILENYSNDIVIAFRPYYIQKRGVTPELANVLWCAREQEKFFDLRDEVYKKVAQDEFLISNIFSLAEEIGLDRKELLECSNDRKYVKKVNALASEAKNSNVFGSPTTFINNELIIGARTWEDQIDSNGEMVSGLKTIISRNLEN